MDTSYHQLIEVFHRWPQYFRLPPRGNRINPRVIKWNRVKFRRERSVKVPPFADVVRL